MIQSMTGFGKSQGIVASKKIIVEIKSVNSKGFDIYTKMPSLYREKDIDIRKMIGNTLQRGKVECAVFYDVLEDTSGQKINRGLVDSYLQEIKSLEEEHSIKTADYMSTILKMPDIYKTERVELGDKEWEGLKALIEQASLQLIDFRTSEGLSISQDFLSNVADIERLLSEVGPYEHERVTILKDKLHLQLEEIGNKVEVDSNRLEQELIYYIEKFDVNEEKVRLKNHCDYFKETLASPQSNGKKLGFIAQEMGREINTLGSKANHAEIQKIVVQMKDALEKIKEQILNVL